MKIFACLRYSFARARVSDARSKLSHSIESEKPSVVIVEPEKRSELAAAAVDAEVEKCEMPGQQRRQSQPEKRREPNEYVRRIEVFRLVRRNIVQARGREKQRGEAV